MTDTDVMRERGMSYLLGLFHIAMTDPRPSAWDPFYIAGTMLAVIFDEHEESVSAEVERRYETTRKTKVKSEADPDQEAT